MSFLTYLRFYVGDSALFLGLRSYLNGGGFVDSQTLKRHFEQASGKNLTALFEDFLPEEGYPKLTFWLNKKEMP